MVASSNRPHHYTTHHSPRHDRCLTTHILSIYSWKRIQSGCIRRGLSTRALRVLCVEWKPLWRPSGRMLSHQCGFDRMLSLGLGSSLVSNEGERCTWRGQQTDAAIAIALETFRRPGGGFGWRLSLGFIRGAAGCSTGRPAGRPAAAVLAAASSARREGGAPGEGGKLMPPLPSSSKFSGGRDAGSGSGSTGG